MQIITTDFDTAVQAAIQSALDRRAGPSAGKEEGVAVHFVNAWVIALADGDSEYRALLNRGHAFPDGKPVAWRASRGSAAGAEQVRGPAFFRGVLDQGRRVDMRHAFVGGTPETLARLKEEVAREYPDAAVVAAISPPFRSRSKLELERDDAEIISARPDFVWVGLGTPKQDAEVARLAREGGLFAVAVGAAFDFVAGTTREAPKWISRIGFEWAFRLCSEPRRLWRRYLVGNVLFLRAILRRSVDDED